MRSPSTDSPKRKLWRFDGYKTSALVLATLVVAGCKSESPAPADAGLGDAGGDVHQADVGLDVRDAPLDAGTDSSVGRPCSSREAGWWNEAVSPQSDAWIIHVQLRPGEQNMNGLVGFADGVAAAFDDVALAVRFNEDGALDVRDGDVYRADVEVTYDAGEQFLIRIEGQTSAHTYSVFVSRDGDDEVVLARDYAFRTSQQAVSSLDHWVVWNSDDSSLEECGLRLVGESTCGDGVRADVEACDDGNQEDGDCCSADCTTSAPADTVCRVAADACDVPESCSSDGLCPADERMSGGECGFVHPGVFIGQSQLDTLAAHIEAGREPWRSAFVAARDSSYGSRTYTASPRAVVECGSYNMPNNGCTEEFRDSSAAFTQALLWVFTGDETYADNAIAILDAWSAVLSAHTNSNAPLVAAWHASTFLRAAEIIRHTTGDLWPADAIAQFEEMLRSAFLPLIIDGTAWYTNGNWELSMIEAVMAAGVFLEDAEVFEQGVTMWRRRVPAYIYMESDGATPHLPPGADTDDIDRLWHGQSTFMDGLSQETCRDLGHVALGLSALSNAAETGRLQGIDLFQEESERITTGYEFHTKFLNDADIPAELCDGELVFTSGFSHTNEVGYGAARRLGIEMPQTRMYLEAQRPTGVSIFRIWETLTHGVPLE